MLGVAQPFGLATPTFIIEPFLCGYPLLVNNSPENIENVGQAVYLVNCLFYCQGENNFEQPQYYCKQIECIQKCDES